MSVSYNGHLEGATKKRLFDVFQFFFLIVFFGVLFGVFLVLFRHFLCVEFCDS